MDQRRETDARGAEAPAETGKISRRAMVAGTVATTMVAAALPLANSAFAEAQGRRPDEDMVAFLLLSEALTGVDRHTLAPEFPAKSKEPIEILEADPGVDPINIKNLYFDLIRFRPDLAASFAKLLQIAKDSRKSKGDIIPKVNAAEDPTKYLARSIVLLWYLGAWYEPIDLKTSHDRPDLLNSPIPSVVKAKGYTQGLVWQIAGAHPMGYSNLQFGYWSRDPHDPNGLNGKPLPLFSPSES